MICQFESLMFACAVFVSQLYRSDSDSSTLPKKSPFVRNTLERRTLRYKQVQAFIQSLICLAGVTNPVSNVFFA